MYGAVLLSLTESWKPKSRSLPARMQDLLREYQRKMEKQPHSCLLVPWAEPLCCWLSLEAAASPGTALCMVWSVFLTRKIMRQWQLLPAILCLENFSHGACRLNSRQKENELLIKICLDSLLCF